jgi:hypothetical protein
MPTETGRPSDGEPARREPRALARLLAEFLKVIYSQDHEAEARQRDKWRRTRQRDPAGQWRWIPYSTEHQQADPTAAQEELARSGIRGNGARAALAALTQRGFIQFRIATVETIHGTVRQQQVRLTRSGRQAARENHPASAQCAQRIAPWLEEALTAVRDAPAPGLPKIEITRTAARILGPSGYHFIEDQNEWAYKITDKGLSYLHVWTACR